MLKDKKKRVEKAKKQCMQCIVIPRANDQFEVSYWQDNSIIYDFQKKSYGCNVWNISGILYQYACVAILFCNKLPIDYVSSYYNKAFFIKAYKMGIEPVPDPDDKCITNYNPSSSPIIKKKP